MHIRSLGDHGTASSGPSDVAWCVLTPSQVHLFLLSSKRSFMFGRTCLLRHYMLLRAASPKGELVKGHTSTVEICCSHYHKVHILGEYVRHVSLVLPFTMSHHALWLKCYQLVFNTTSKAYLVLIV